MTDVIFTRDPWMHRIDISRATGRPLDLTADHDGVIVADVVAEWSDRHGKDFTLTLDGPAGGTWTVGANGLFCTSRRSSSAAACPGDLAISASTTSSEPGCLFRPGRRSAVRPRRT